MDLKDQYLCLFEQEMPRPWNQQGIAGYRTRTIRAGEVLEAEIYPIWQTRTDSRKARAAVTREAQQRLNDRNSLKRMVRKINANFTAADLAMTLTYRAGEKLPVSRQEARRDMANYIARLNRWRRQHGLDKLRYVYVIEWCDGEGQPRRIHHHLIMSGMDRDVAERIWGKGYANAHRLQPDGYGLEAITRYMFKAKRHRQGQRIDGSRGRAWSCSRGLKEPDIRTSDHRLSRRRVRQMAEDFQNKPAEILEKVFPGYGLMDCQIRYSPYVEGVYIYATLHRKRPKPRRKSRVATDAGRRVGRLSGRHAHGAAADERPMKGG